MAAAATSLLAKGLDEGAIASQPGLTMAAARSGRFFGSAVRNSQLLSDPQYAMLIATECASITPELELKWAAVEHVRGELHLSSLDDMTAFALKHGMIVHGHTLLWDKSVPAWAVDELLAGDWSGIQRYMASVMPRLGGVVRYWDVINEPIDTGQRMDGLRNNVFLRGFGPDYVRRALETARTFQPNGKLLINEYGLEYEMETEEFRRYHFLRLIESLRAASVPLDGVGLQAHLDLRKGKVSQPKLATLLNELSQLDLEILVTELDVREADYVASAERRDIAVADETRRYLDVVLAYPAVKGVTTWGLSDRYSWLDITSQDLASQTNAWTDGTGPGLNRGLPFNSSLKPKPMYQAVIDAFAKD